MNQKCPKSFEVTPQNLFKKKLQLPSKSKCWTLNLLSTSCAGAATISSSGSKGLFSYEIIRYITVTVVTRAEEVLVVLLDQRLPSFVQYLQNLKNKLIHHPENSIILQR